jgi:O-antigen/teichoic acid export membrane protein
MTNHLTNRPQRKPSLKINAISNWISFGIIVATGIILTPIITEQLGKTGYGIWSLVGSLIGYYGLLNLGVGSAITRYIARYTAQRNEVALNEVVSTVFTLFIITGLVATAFSFFFAAQIAVFFNVKPELTNDFKTLVWIIGLATGIGFSNEALAAISNAREHFVSTNIVRIASILLRASLTIIFLNLGYGLISVAIAPLISTIASTFANIYLYKKYASDIKIGFKHANRKTLKMLLIYGGTTTVIVLADLMRGNFDNIVIGKLIGLEAVGVYSIAALLVRHMSSSVTAGLSALTPRLAALDGMGEKNKTKALFLKSLSVSSFLAFGAGMIAVIFGENFIYWWVGKEFSEASSVLVILAGVSAFGLTQNPAIGLLYALNKHKKYAIATIIEAVFNVALSLLLISKYGIIGVAIGTAIPMLVSKIFIMPIYASKAIEIPLSIYLKPSIWPAATSMLIVILAYTSPFHKNLPDRIEYLVGTAFLIGLIYSGLCFTHIRKQLQIG